MSNFQDIHYYERSLFMAKLYNHAWYDAERFAVLNQLLNKWEKEPSKEVKFLNDIHEEININDLIN